MKKNIITSNLFKLAFVSLAVSFLASCSSTTQFTSRKYTKGYFSDPIAKVNVNSLPSSPAPCDLTPAKQTQVVITNTTPKVSTPIAPAKETRINAAAKKGISFTNSQKSVKIATTNVPASSINKDNVSLADNTITTVASHGDGDGGGGHGYLWKALICLLVAILATILAVVVGLGGALGLAVFLYIVAVVAWIAFLVFCILALIALFGGM